MNVLLVAEYDDFLLSAVRALGEAGAAVYVQVADARRGGFFRSSRHCRGAFRLPSLLETDSGKRQEHIRSIQETIDRNKIDVIIGVDVFGVLFLSMAREELRRVMIFPVSNTDTIRMLNDKWQFAGFAARHGIPHPRTRLIRRPENLSEMALGNRAVVKKLDADWGDVKILRVPDEVNAYVGATLKREPGPLLLQEFIPGRDIDMSLLAQNGKIVCWTIQEWLPGSGLIFRRDERVHEICERIVALSGFEGVAHFDLRIDDRDESVKVLECNPRFWGSLNASVRCGVNFIRIGARLALGEPVTSDIRYRAVPYVSASTLLKSVLRGKFKSGAISGPVFYNMLMNAVDPVPTLHKALFRRFRRKQFHDTSIRPLA